MRSQQQGAPGKRRLIAVDSCMPESTGLITHFNKATGFTMALIGADTVEPGEFDT